MVEISHMPPWPDATDDLEWGRYNSFNLHDDHYDMLGPSKFARPSVELDAFMKIAELEKPVGDPMTALRTLQRAIYDSFEYQSGVTEVNSPIEVALEQRRGVCQDFAHIMTAIARQWGIPTRYVSGYLYHKGSRDRSAADATHAWVESYLPSLGWVGFDPTNNILAVERHVRAAVGRDYADVPPTRGTYKGGADSELSIAVSLEPTQAPVRHEDFLKVARPMATPTPTPSMPERLYHQQQQQQQ
jgi:transglutaminase-like putative cysteine protease